MRYHIVSFDQIGDVHEAASLVAASPNLNLTAVRIDSLDHFPTDCGWCLFAPAVPGAVGSIHIVETGNERFQSSLGPVLLAENFRDKLFPTISTFGHCRVGVGL